MLPLKTVTGGSPERLRSRMGERCTQLYCQGCRVVPFDSSWWLGADSLGHLRKKGCLGDTLRH